MYKKSNFAKGELAAQLLSGGTSLVLDTGQGDLFPATGSANTFPAVIWSSAYATPFEDTTREIVVAYRSSGNTFTIVRAQENTSAKQWEIGDQFMLTATAGVFNEYETALGTKATLSGVSGGQTLIGGTAATDTLKLQGTSGNGTLTSPAIQALVGNNGATTALTVLNNGNVGIGTTSPGAKLDIVSGADNLNTLLLSDSTTEATIKDGFVTTRHYTNAEEPLAVIQGRSESAKNRILIGGTHLTTTYNAATDIEFYTASTNTNTNPGTARMIINSTGNVGISTTNPGAKLEVNGTIKSSNTVNSTINNVYSFLTGNTTSNATNYFRSGFFQTYGTNNGYTNSGYLKAFEAEALIRDNGTTANVFGATFSVGNYGASGADPQATINNLYGASYSLYNKPLSTIGNVYGNSISLPTSGTITGSMYGLIINSNSLASGTAKYGVYIGAMSGATNNYGIYSAGGTNYFEGKVGIGTTSPNSLLSVASYQPNSNTFNYLNFNNLGSGYGDWWVQKTGSNNLSFAYGVETTEAGKALTLQYGGNVGIGTTSPTAYLNIKAGTASSGTAPIKLTAGVLNTAPEAGAIEYNGNDFYLTVE